MYLLFQNDVRYKPSRHLVFNNQCSNSSDDRAIPSTQVIQLSKPKNASTERLSMEFFLNGAELSLNSANSTNSRNLINHWSINWAQFKDPVSHICLAGKIPWNLSNQHPRKWANWPLFHTLCDFQDVLFFIEDFLTFTAQCLGSDLTMQEEIKQGRKWNQKWPEWVGDFLTCNGRSHLEQFHEQCGDGMLWWMPSHFLAPSTH